MNQTSKFFPEIELFNYDTKGILKHVLCLPCCQEGSAAALEAPQLSKLLRNKNYDSLRRILKYLRTKLPT